MAAEDFALEPATVLGDTGLLAVKVEELGPKSKVIEKGPTLGIELGKLAVAGVDMLTVFGLSLILMALACWSSIWAC